MKSNALHTTILFGALAASLIHLQAGATVAVTKELKVVGVIRPAACELELGGGSTSEVSYGTIRRETLKDNEFNKLDTMDLSFRARCDSTTKIGITVTDNRSSSKVSNLATLVAQNATENSMYGLGAVGNRNVGAYRIAMKDFRGDNVALLHINSPVPGSGQRYTWSASSTDGVQTGRMQSWRSTSTPGGVVDAGSYSLITGALAITAVLNRASALPTGEEVPLDGSATLVLNYI